MTAGGDLLLPVPTPERMRGLGAALGHVAEPGDRFLLEGPFGAGKTTFVQGLATGLGVEAPVSSPSFVLETRYQGRLPLFHVDLYRIEQLDAELAQALEEHLYADEAVTAIEWSEHLPAPLRTGATRVRIDIADGEGRVVALATDEPRLTDAAESWRRSS